LFLHASEEAREAILPSLLNGSMTMCFAMSEPDAGSDSWMMRCRAVPVEGGWMLSGTKQWITNGPYADHAFVFAVTDLEDVAARRGGITAFIVPTNAPGFRIDSTIRMFGHHGGDEAIISLNDVFVPDTGVVGDVGRGMHLALSGVSTGRFYNAARSVGLAQWALELALAYAEERVTFGKPLIENQGIAFPLADSAMEIHAARLIGLDAARAYDAGHEVRKELSMAKAYATEAAVRTIDRAMQVHGALGFTNELRLSEAWQQARRICVADGSAEIMRQQIVKHLRSEGRSH
jgi:alkylation response protein AidB-like acyl-CoA dehydrogenase